MWEKLVQFTSQLFARRRVVSTVICPMEVTVCNSATLYHGRTNMIGIRLHAAAKERPGREIHFKFLLQQNCQQYSSNPPSFSWV